jgi:hypothetical protein
MRNQTHSVPFGWRGDKRGLCQQVAEDGVPVLGTILNDWCRGAEHAGIAITVIRGMEEIGEVLIVSVHGMETFFQHRMHRENGA